MTVIFEYHNVNDEEVGQRVGAESESFVDDRLRTTSFSAYVRLEPPTRLVQSIFIGNYRDEEKKGTNRAPYLVYMEASATEEGLESSQFQAEVWIERVFGKKDKIAALFSGEPSDLLPSALYRGKVRFDWSSRDASFEIVFPVPQGETVGSFEWSCRALDRLLIDVLGEAEHLSRDVISKLLEGQSANRKVFLCHSTRDKYFVRSLAASLKSQGLAVWFDEDELLPGHDFVEQMNIGLAQSTFVAVVLSPNFLHAGPWANEEFRSALCTQVTEKRVVVLPVMFQDCEIPPVLRSKLFADFRKSFDLGLGQLVRAIRGHHVGPH